MGARNDELRRLVNIIKPHWKRVAVAGLVSFAISGVSAFLAWLVKPAMDDLFVHQNTRLLLLLPVVIFVIFIVRGILTFAYEYLMQSAAQKLTMNLRNELYGHILQLPIGHFSDESSGALISRVINDTGAVQQVLSLTVKQFVVEAATAVGLVAYIFWLKWDLALLAVILLPSALYGASYLAKRLKRISMRIQEKAALIVQDLSESFTGIRIIKAFLREGREKLMFTEKNQDYYRENMRAVRIKEAVSIIMDIVAGLGVSFVIWYGASSSIKGQITAGEFSSFLAALFLVNTPVKRLSRVNAELQQVRAPLERIFKVLSMEKEEQGTLTIPAIKSDIEFIGVDFAYPSQTINALEGLNLKVKKGEIVAIVGESGSGKSTLVSLLPRFISPTKGRLLMDGVDIGKATLESLRGQFGIVSQEVVLFNDTVRANIAFGKPDATNQEIENAAVAAYAHDFIQEFSEKYDTQIGEKGIKLSGGQRQRISIARAILKNPPILILDEATSALDTSSELMVQLALENLMKERTTFVIAHRLSTIRKATKIVVLEKGRIAAVGTHDELLKNSVIYRRLYELQFGLKVS